MAKQAGQNYQNAANYENETLGQLYEQAKNEVVGISKPTKYETYEIGDEVSVGGENFYVIEKSDEKTETVTLLTKYLLNIEQNCQDEALMITDGSSGGVVFSDTVYWTPDGTDMEPLDLNMVQETPSVSAIGYARTYATSIGAVKGGLIRRELAWALMDYLWMKSVPCIIDGEAFNKSIEFWTADAWVSSWSGSVSVTAVSGVSESVSGYAFEDQVHHGVRPVVVVRKELVNLVKANESNV